MRISLLSLLFWTALSAQATPHTEEHVCYAACTYANGQPDFRAVVLGDPHQELTYAKQSALSQTHESYLCKHNVLVGECSKVSREQPKKYYAVAACTRGLKSEDFEIKTVELGEGASAAQALAMAFIHLSNKWECPHSAAKFMRHSENGETTIQTAACLLPNGEPDFRTLVQSWKAPPAVALVVAIHMLRSQYNCRHGMDFNVL